MANAKSTILDLDDVRITKKDLRDDHLAWLWARQFRKPIRAVGIGNFGYVYLITFIRPTDGKEYYYVGQHIASKLDTNYHGSGLILNRLKAKYGINGNLHLVILNWATSPSELNFKEILTIRFAKLHWGATCINLSYAEAVGRHSVATRNKIGLANRGRRRKEVQCPHCGFIGRGAMQQHHFDNCPNLTGVPREGLERSAETRLRIRNKAIGRSASLATRARMSIARLGMTRSPETRTKMSQSQRDKPRVTCPHCGVLGSINVMKRWHFDNCSSVTSAPRRALATLECPYCGKEGSTSNMKRWHFANCKAHLTGEN